jgi:FAD/FMN-containing dehydrogenase
MIKLIFFFCSIMSIAAAQLSEVRKLLSKGEIIEPSSPQYAQETRVWAYQKQQNPSLVVRPTSLSSLQTIVRYLSESALDFSIRSSGAGSSSAKDVVVSLNAFNEVVFNRDDETVLVGAGQIWGDVDRKLAEQAPDYVGMSIIISVVLLTWVTNRRFAIDKWAARAYLSLVSVAL